MIFLTDENIYLTAYIKGDISSPNLNGIAYFKPFKDGVMVEVEVSNLPGYKSYELFPIHIHDADLFMIKSIRKKYEEKGTPVKS